MALPPVYVAGAALLNLQMHISWQAQHFVNLQVQSSWQAQHFLNLKAQISWRAQNKMRFREIADARNAVFCNRAPKLASLLCELCVHSFLHGWRRYVCREAQVTLIELNRDTKEVRAKHQNKAPQHKTNQQTTPPTKPQGSARLVSQKGCVSRSKS